MSEPEQDESPIEPGMTNRRRAPRWTIPFLRALARTGDARASAEDAGIDHSTAYARRRAHADFAEAWAAALREHGERTEREKDAEVEAFVGGLNRPSPGSPAASPTSPARGRGEEEELTAANGQMKRVGHDRWSKRKEKLFFDELVATNNIKRSAKAAGVSYNAVLARRLRDAHFRAKWEAVVQCAKAGIGMHLLEAANNTFDPETLDLQPATPKVTVAEAIRITQARAPKAQPEEAPDPFAWEGDQANQLDADEVREHLIRKLRRLRDRDMPEMIAEGWSFDEKYDHLVPPGWVRAGSEAAGRTE